MRGWNRLVKGAVFIGALGGLTSAVFAQNDPRVPVSFGQYVPAEVNGLGSVSQSKLGTASKPEFKSQVTYRFTIANNTTNVLNRSFFSAIVYNATSTATTQPSIDEALTDAGTCSIDATTRSVRCDLGASGSLSVGSSAAVYLVVNVPYDGQQLAVNWQGGGYEGNGNGNGCCQPSGIYLTSMSEKTSDPTYTSILRTFLNKGGGKYFTGDAYITTRTDAGTTYVDVKPLPQTYDTSKLDAYYTFLTETIVPADSKGTGLALDCASAKRFNSCFQTELEIPQADLSKYQTVDPSTEFDPAALLDIIVRIDAGVIRNGTKIDNVYLRYDGTLVPPCVYNANNTLSAGNLPCLAKRFEWKPSVTGYTPDLNKDFQFELKHYRNGRYEVF